MLWTSAFWKGAAERSIKTFAVSTAGLIAGNALGIVGVDWAGTVSIAGLATLGTLLIAIGNADFVAGAPAAVVDYKVVDLSESEGPRHTS